MYISRMLSRKQVRLLRETPWDGPNKLPLARDLAGMTQVELAASIGFKQPHVSRIEAGDYRMSLELARRFARLFGCTDHDLFPDSLERAS
jgi:DNA-binding XRE family transcriptional regulator